MIYSMLHKAPHTATTDTHTEASKQTRRCGALSASHVQAWGSCSMWGNRFACWSFFFIYFYFFWFYCLALHQGQWGWGICSEIGMSLLFSPSCALHKAYLSSPLFLTQRAQTHSHGQLPFNSQLGIRKLECWGELHKKNINVNKKTGTCVAVSCHPKEC